MRKCMYCGGISEAADQCTLCGRMLPDPLEPAADLEAANAVRHTDASEAAPASEEAAAAKAAPEAEAPDPGEEPPAEGNAFVPGKPTIRLLVQKHKKAAAGVIIAGGLAVGVLIAGTVYYFASPAQDVKKLIEQQNFDQAERVYLDELKGNGLQESMLRQTLKATVKDSIQSYNQGRLSLDVYLRQSELIVSFGFEGLNQTIRDHFARIADGLAASYIAGTAEYYDAERQLTDIRDAGVIDADVIGGLLDDMAALRDSRSAYRKADTYYQYGNYAEALKCYRQVIPADENYDTAQQQIIQCENAYRHEVLEQTLNPTATEEYRTAMQRVDDALTLLPGDEALTARRAELETGYAAALRQEALDYAEQYTNNLNFQAALDVLRTALKDNEEDPALLDAMTRVKSAYSTYAKKLVANCLASRDYDTAYTYLAEACSQMPEDEALQALLKDLSTSAPTGLHTLTPVKSNRYEAVTQGDAADVFGNSYSSGNLFRISAHSGDWGDADLGYAEYDLNQAYTQLYGTIVLASDSSKGSCRIEILGDGKTLYTSPALTRESAPIRVELKLNGVDQLEIRMTLEDNASETVMTALLSGFQLFS